MAPVVRGAAPSSLLLLLLFSSCCCWYSAHPDPPTAVFCQCDSQERAGKDAEDDQRYGHCEEDEDEAEDEVP